MTANSYDVSETATELTAEQFEEQFTNAVDQIRGQQVGYKKARGRKALASMIASGFVTIEFIEAHVDAEVRNLVLSQHQVKPATGKTSRYSPWIAVMWGEDKLDAPKVEALDGKEYAAWEPNTSMAVYFHTMEHLRESGFTANSDVKAIIDHIMDKRGSQTIANERKAKIKAQATSEAAPTIAAQRDFYLSNGPSAAIELDTGTIVIPADAGQFIGLVVERAEGGGFIVRGVSDKDANAKLNRLAADSYVALKKAVDDAEVERLRNRNAELEAAMAKSAPVGTEQNPMRLSPESIAKMAAAAKAKIADRQN